MVTPFKARESWKIDLRLHRSKLSRTLFYFIDGKRRGRTEMEPRIMTLAPATSGSDATPSEVGPVTTPSQAGTSWDILSRLIANMYFSQKLK